MQEFCMSWSFDVQILWQNLVKSIFKFSLYFIKTIQRRFQLIIFKVAFINYNIKDVKI